MRAFKVTVDTTNGLRKTTYGPNKNVYENCVDGILYVVSNTPQDIYERFICVKKIEEIGIGYIV